MSIASQLAALAANKAAIKAAIIAKSPAAQPTDALSSWPASIESIPSGGASADGEVKFIDYDGSVLTSYTVAEASALTAMPSLPSHEGLSAQDWNYTLEQMKSNLSSGACNIGCMYTTDDGKTRITLTIQDAKYSEIPLVFHQTAANGVQVDWGDGSAVQTYSDETLTATHQYSPQSYPATYIVTFNVTNGKMWFPSYIMGKSGTQSETNPIAAWTNMIDSVRIGNGVTGITSNTFTNCYSLASITIPNSVRSIGDYAFRYCYSLASITIPNSITSIGYNTFEYCRSLASVTIPSSVTSINVYAFSYCQSLASVTIPSSVTSIGQSVFYGGCYSLASVTIPSSVTIISNYAFNGCYSLASITIPNSVTSIGTYAFSNCYSLASITIPNSITSIGTYAFSNCYGIKTYDFRTATAVPQLVGVNTFNNTPSDKEIIVPDELYDTWIAASNWNSTTNNIVNCIVKASESSLGPLN